MNSAHHPPHNGRGGWCLRRCLRKCLLDTTEGPFGDTWSRIRHHSLLQSQIRQFKWLLMTTKPWGETCPTFCITRAVAQVSLDASWSLTITWMSGSRPVHQKVLSRYSRRSIWRHLLQNQAPLPFGLHFWISPGDSESALSILQKVHLETLVPESCTTPFCKLQLVNPNDC